MFQDLPELSAKLEDEVAAERIPPSLIDLDRACQDGYRSRRKRQALATATGIGAVGLCAALAAVMLPDAFGGAAQRVAAPATAKNSASVSAAASTPLTYEATVPASFGWLPENVDYIITGPPIQGDSVFSARASGYISGVQDTSAPSAGQATVFLTLNSTEDAAGGGSSPYRIAGPKIGGAQSYWITKVAGDETNNGEPTLEWQTASGQWAEVDASDMGGDPLLPTVEHIAETVHIGETSLALPVQIKGLPDSFGITQIVLTEPAHSTDSDDWRLFTNFTLKPGGASHGSVYIVAQGTDVGPTTGVGLQSTKSASDCKTTNRIVYCATTIYTGATPAEALPTDTQALGEVTLFGNSQSSWSPDLLVP